MIDIHINGHPTDAPGSAVLALFLLFVLIMFGYVLPTFYNYWILFTKAKKPGWAAIVPVYGSIVAARIAKLPVYVGVLLGISMIRLNNAPEGIQNIEGLVALVTGIIVFAGLMKQYKAQASFWAFMILLPIIASTQVKSVTFKKGKSGRKTK